MADSARGPEQDEPVASDADKIAGIVAQTAVDYPGDDVAELEARLRQRFSQSAIDVADEDVARLVADMATASRDRRG